MKKTFAFLAVLFNLIIFLCGNAGNIDACHIHMSERGSAFRKSFIVLIVSAFKVPVILHTHSADFHVFYSSLSKPIQNYLKWALNKSQKVITLSESWKRYYADHLSIEESKIEVLPNPVHIPRLSPKENRTGRVHFLFLGRIGVRKGAYDLIQSFSQLSKKANYNFQLTMAGDGENKKARDVVESLGLSDKIEILYWVDAKRKSELLSQADVFLLPSYNEGLPMALLEAMSFALPVITTPVGGIPEVITHLETGILVQPGDVKDLARSIENLICDEKLRQRLGSNARAKVSPLDIDNYINSLYALYQLVNGTSKRANQQVACEQFV